MKRGKRGWSRAFPGDAATEKNYLLAHIPAPLWAAVRAQAKRDGLSLRTLILQLLTEYTRSSETRTAQIRAAVLKAEGKQQ